MTLPKLIDEYKLKVNSIDCELDALAAIIRRKRMQEDEYADLLDERRNKNCIRQVYIQVIEDLKDIAI